MILFYNLEKAVYNENIKGGRRMKERKVSIIFKLLVMLSLLTGILLNVVHTISISAILSYYTLLSNSICLVMFVRIMGAIILKKDYRSDSKYYCLKGAIVIAISITAITYQVALAPNGFQMDISYTMRPERYWANIFVHIISPIMVIGDYLLFDEKGNLKYSYPFIWLGIPWGYVIYVYIYHALGGRFFGIGGSREYAYKFLDYKQIGYLGVIKWILVFMVAIFVLSNVLVFFDRRKKHK